jgi:hypothetical protein
MKTLTNILFEALQEKQRFAKEKGEKYQDFNRFEQLHSEHASEHDIYLFVQYSNVHKLGLNPKSDFNTPLGIYSYPAMMFTLQQFQNGRLPFAADRKFMTVFTIKPAYKDKLVVLRDDGTLDASYSSFTDAKLEEMTAKHAANVDQAKRQMEHTHVKTPFGHYFNITRNAANGNPGAWSQLMMKDGIFGIVDLGSKIIHDNEPDQAVFFRSDVLDLLAVVDNPVVGRKFRRDVVMHDIDMVGTIMHRNSALLTPADQELFDVLDKAFHQDRVMPNLAPYFETLRSLKRRLTEPGSVFSTSFDPLIALAAKQGRAK